MDLNFRSICLRNNLFLQVQKLPVPPPTMAMMVTPLVGREELSHETNLREGCKNVWTTPWKGDE